MVLLSDEKLSDSEQALYLLVLGASLPAIEADSVTESVLLRSVPFILDPTRLYDVGNFRHRRPIDLSCPPAAARPSASLSPLPPSIVHRLSARIADKPCSFFGSYTFLTDPCLFPVAHSQNQRTPPFLVFLIGRLAPVPFSLQTSPSSSSRPLI